MERETRERWAERVAEWKASGKSIREFAGVAGLNARSLAWWRWELDGAKRKGDSRKARGTRRRRPSRKTTTPSALTFVEMTAAASDASLELVLPSAVRIRVGPGFDAATLGRLMAVLESRR
jgi:hypothetical protein